MNIEIRNVTKRYGKKTALDNVSLTLGNGIYGLLGANGGGNRRCSILWSRRLRRPPAVFCITGRT